VEPILAAYALLRQFDTDQDGQVSAQEFAVVGELDRANRADIVSSMYTTVREARHELELENRERGSGGTAAQEGAHKGAVKSLTKRRLKAMVGQLIARKKAEAAEATQT